MRIIISGGCGFVGSNLALYLKEMHPEFELVCFDNLKRRGSELNIPRLKSEGIEFIHGDMRNQEDLNSLGSADLFIDASAEPSVLAGINSSQRQLINNNLTSTINALDFCVEHGAKLLFLSTSRVYPIRSLEEASFVEQDIRFNWSDDQKVAGLSSEGVAEDFPMNGTRSLYGATKYASELIIEEYGEFLGLDYIINRCGVISGPWQMGKIDQGVVVLWIARHLYNKPLKYIGYGGLGKQVRDILHIHDLCRLVDIQVSNWDKGNKAIFNVGGGLSNSLSLKELTSLCEKYTNTQIEIGAEPENRPADLRLYITDNSKVQNTFNWSPEKSNDDLIKETTEWIVENREILAHILN